MQNTSQSTAISDSSPGSTARWDQARSELQLLYLVHGEPRGRFPVGVASRTWSGVAVQHPPWPVAI